MKNVTRILSLFLACCMAVAALSLSTSAVSVIEKGELNEGCNFTIYSDRTMIVTSVDGIVGTSNSFIAEIRLEASWSEMYDIAPVSKLIISEGCTEISVYCFGGYSFSNLEEVYLPHSLKRINDGAFLGDSKITDVYYAGTESEWEHISIGKNCNYLTDATIHFNSPYNSNIDVEDEPSTPVIPDHAATHIPGIDIADYDGNLLTHGTREIAVDESVTFAVALDTSIWQRDTKVVGNQHMTGYFSRDSLENYYYLLESEIYWERGGATGSASETAQHGGALTLTGVKAGTMTLTAIAPCGYLVSDGEDLYDQGIVGVTSASTTIQVKAASGYTNPFKDIDVDKIENPFADVSKNAWYYKPVISLYAAGMLNGVDISKDKDGTKILMTQGFGTNISVSVVDSTKLGSAAAAFSINGLGTSTGSTTSTTGSTAATKLTFNGNVKDCRSNTVVTLYNGHQGIGGSVGSYTSNPFKDVASGKPYYQQVLWASANSIVNGYGNGKFGPSDGITREQFCAILLRYANYAGITLPSNQPAKTFTDSGKISSWAKNAVAACQKAGIINGYPDGSFKPKAGITSAEVAKMIYEFYNLLP